MPLSAWAALALAAAFAGFSGMNDGGNMVGTFLATRGVPPRLLLPLLIASVALGPVLFGTRVAGTIAVAIVDFSGTGPGVLDVALFAALATLAVSWRLRIPSSTTPALAGGMVGAAWAAGDGRFIHWLSLIRVGVGLVGSVVIGFALTYVVTHAVWRLLRHASWEEAQRLAGWQVATVAAQGLAYGANDQEKAVGLTALALALLQPHGVYHVGPWAVALPLAVWVAGLFAGGWRIARTVGGRIFRLRPLAAMEAQGVAAITVMGAALLGLPVSTTQTTNGCLFGLGAALAPRRVHWDTLKAFAVVWLTVLPLAFAISALSMGAVVTGTRLVAGS